PLLVRRADGPHLLSHQLPQPPGGDDRPLGRVLDLSALRPRRDPRHAREKIIESGSSFRGGKHGRVLRPPSFSQIDRRARRRGYSCRSACCRTACPSQSRQYMFFSAAEVAFVDAAVARLIPADELGPGAKEAGVTYFIDQQLFGGWGTMAKMYRQGPHPEGTPQQGYQSPLTPQEIYRAAIREINSLTPRPFDKLAASEQDELLHRLEDGKLPLESVPGRFFFNLL